jgi:ATP-dependent DNA helicase RecQ
VKDYKLCTTTRNDPVRDAELAYELFLDQREALQQRVAEYPDEALCLHFLLAAESGKGVANLFAALRHKLRPSHAEARAAWSGRPSATCASAGSASFLIAASPTRTGTSRWPMFSPGCVAGGNSVLPPWVGLNFPRVREAIANLRDVPCADPACTWCRDQHDLETLLARYFPDHPVPCDARHAGRPLTPTRNRRERLCRTTDARDPADRRR